jgi:cell division protein FtsB
VIFAEGALVRFSLYIILLLICAPSVAAVTCDQLGNIALATEQYRNQGEPLQVLLAEADKLESGGLTKEDMVKVRKTVQEAYDRTRTPLEIRKDCKDMPGK